MVITVQKGGVKRHFLAEGELEACESVNAGLAEILIEPRSTMRLTCNGQEITPNRYSLCWSWYESDYRPKSAEHLGATGAMREE